MPVYLHASLRIAPGKLQAMLDLLRDDLIPIMEAQGWRILGCFTNISGARNTILDLWELNNLDHFKQGYKGFMEHARFAAIKGRIDEFVVEETLTFLDRIYSGPTA